MIIWHRHNMLHSVLGLHVVLYDRSKFMCMYRINHVVMKLYHDYTLWGLIFKLETQIWFTQGRTLNHRVKTEVDIAEA